LLGAGLGIGVGSVTYSYFYSYILSPRGLTVRVRGLLILKYLSLLLILAVPGLTACSAVT